MQREIKFRGKRLDNGEWVYGFLIQYENGWFICNFIGDAYQYEVDPSTVGQFTGLKDKNGKEIYETDVCSTDLSRPYLIVVFRNGAFMYQCYDGKDYFDIMLPIDAESDVDKYTEVIGNIYENPEDLKDITSEDIENTWYVRLIRDMAEKAVTP